MLLVFISTAIFSSEIRNDIFIPFICFEKQRGGGGLPFFDESGFWVKSELFFLSYCFLYVDKPYFLNLCAIPSLQFQSLYTVASTRKVTVPCGELVLLLLPVTHECPMEHYTQKQGGGGRKGQW
jgi:hypothetical protein